MNQIYLMIMMESKSPLNLASKRLLYIYVSYMSDMDLWDTALGMMSELGH